MYMYINILCNSLPGTEYFISVEVILSFFIFNDPPKENSVP